MSRVVTFINQTNGIDDQMLQNFVADLSNTLSTSFENAWSISASASSVGGGYHIYLLDLPETTDPQGALGYHTLDQQFLPYARVFVQLASDNGIPWTQVASHEALEMLVDPFLQSLTFLDSGNGYSGWIIYDEIADPVEQQAVIGANGSAISNFVLPGWYVPGYTGKVDMMGLLKGPLRLASGGYASADYVERGSGWQTFTGFKRSPGFKHLQKVKGKENT